MVDTNVTSPTHNASPQGPAEGNPAGRVPTYPSPPLTPPPLPPPPPSPHTHTTTTSHHHHHPPSLSPPLPSSLFPTLPHTPTTTTHRSRQATRPEFAGRLSRTLSVTQRLPEGNPAREVPGGFPLLPLPLHTHTAHTTFHPTHPTSPQPFQKS